ncbi:hypothetical protein [Roseococcus microcysteis]|uniref:hypothetical protein n=1 Tax=Roseococcus microcysteis TaxID=2771361 RepID=UPI00168A675F|nr:hypothetical protein [Roseococcus microcysteis]
MTDSVTFAVLALPEPGLLPRLLQPFAKRDLTPDHMLAERQGEEMRVTFTLHAPDSGVLHLIAGNLGQVVGVLAVEMQEARWAEAA